MFFFRAEPAEIESVYFRSRARMADREDAAQGSQEIKKSKWESREKMGDKVTAQIELINR